MQEFHKNIKIMLKELRHLIRDIQPTEIELAQLDSFYSAEKNIILLPREAIIQFTFLLLSYLQQRIFSKDIFGNSLRVYTRRKFKKTSLSCTQRKNVFSLQEYCKTLSK